MPLENIRFRGDGAPATFQEVLSELKQRGCNLLLTGEVPAVVSDVATNRLLGAPFEDRKRVLALSGVSLERVSSRLPSGTGPGDRGVCVLVHRDDVRSAAVQSPESRAWMEPAGPDLETFRAAICGAIERFDERSGGLAPAELRLSVDSLATLLADSPTAEVHSFLDGVAATVDGVNGMGHYHLPLSDDSALVRELTPHFSARIELRQRGNAAPEQRWHVPAYDETTNWVRL